MKSIREYQHTGELNRVYLKEISTYPASTRCEEVIIKLSVAPQQVSLHSSRRFHCHLATVLQDSIRELRSGHTCQPKSEVSVNLVRINVFDKLLKGGHPGGSQMAVLEEYPSSSLHSGPHHGFSTRTLPLSKGDGSQLFREFHFLKKYSIKIR